MLDPESTKKIAIVSPCGTLNLGDEATVAVLIRDLKRRCPNAEILALTTNPGDTQNRHRIPAYPARNTNGNSLRRGSASRNTSTAQSQPESGAKRGIKQALKKLPPVFGLLKLGRKGWDLMVNSFQEIAFVKKGRQQLAGADLLIFAGSGQLCDDFGGTWGFPYTIVKWSMIARTVGAKIVFLSVGVGPISTTLSRIFIRWALGLGDYCSFRDEESRNLAEKIGAGGQGRVCPDLVFNLTPNVARHTPKRPRRVVAINPFPHFDYRYWPVSVPESYARYVERLASFASWLIKNDYTVLFVPTQLRADPLVIEDIKRAMRKTDVSNLDEHLIVMPTATVDDLIEQLSMADIVVASRFHAVLISFLMNKPVLALSHHSKVDNLMRDMGQSEYLLDIDEFDLQTVTDRVTSLDATRNDIKKQIRSTVAAYQGRVESQYGAIFTMASAPAKSRGYTPSDVFVRPR